MAMNLGTIGTQAMVVSPHRLASAAGARMLAQGGNAFDAAVAVSACLAVVYPHMTGMGGDCFWLAYHSSDRKVRAYNGSGRSGYAANRHAFAGELRIPERGARSAITVPGMVDGWDAMLREYGSLTLEEVLQPAIAYAEEGFPLSASQAVFTANYRAMLEKQPRTSRIYLPGGRLPQAGVRFLQRDLARSLRIVTKQGRDGFYKGPIAREIAAGLREEGGLLTEEDFAEHRGKWEEPLCGSYRGRVIYQSPPNSQGFTGIMILNMLETFDFTEIDHGSFDYYHRLVEAVKLVFRDRDQVLTDPDFAEIPLDRLLSKSYASFLAGSIHPNRASIAHSEPKGSDTAYAAVVDAEGNAVSFIQSLYYEFGSAFIAGDTGILLQNRGSYFSLDPQHVNGLEPCKRTFHTLMPAMACIDGKPAILYGTQGGEGQPQTQTAIITRMIDYGMSPQEAVDQPRWLWGRTWGEDRQDLRLEGRVARDTIDRLKQAGHPVQVVKPYDDAMGHAHAIAIRDGFYCGGTDPRSDGMAIGW